MTPDQRVVIGGLEYRDVPLSWVAAGSHHNPQSGAPRRYCTLTAVDANGEVHVRYVHPANSDVAKIVFEGIDAESGRIPVQLVRENANWPISITRNSWSDIEKVGAVRADERDLLWKLHGDWLDEHTVYGQKEGSGVDGGPMTQIPTRQ